MPFLRVWISVKCSMTSDSTASMASVSANRANGYHLMSEGHSSCAATNNGDQDVVSSHSRCQTQCHHAQQAKQRRL